MHKKCFRARKIWKENEIKKTLLYRSGKWNKFIDLEINKGKKFNRKILRQGNRRSVLRQENWTKDIWK